MSDRIKVKAIKPGFIDSAYRAVGDVFEVEKGAFSDFWMQKEEDERTISQSAEADIARRENAGAALDRLGNQLAGNPVDMDAMTDEELNLHYQTVMGEKPHHSAKRETLIDKITAKLSED